MYCYVVYLNNAKVVDVNSGGYHLADDSPPYMFTFKELVQFFADYGETFAVDNDKVEILTVR
jgi:membrane protease subunit (stomatin/prohibitin family)